MFKRHNRLLETGKICYLENFPPMNITVPLPFYRRSLAGRSGSVVMASVAFDDGVGQVSGTW